MDLCREIVWCACGCVLHHQLEAVDRVYDFLAGLNSQFNRVRARILSQRPIPSLMEVCCEVKFEEDRSSAMNVSRTSLTKSTAFSANTSEIDNKGKQTPICDH